MKTPASKAGDGDLYGLTREDCRILRGMVEEFHNQRRNAPSHPDASRSHEEVQDYLAPEVYIVSTATSSAGTGTGADTTTESISEEDVDVYKADLQSDPPLIEQAGFAKTIIGTFDVILRDKFGHWVKVGSSSPAISFILRKDLEEGGGWTVAEKIVYRHTDDELTCAEYYGDVGTGTGTFVGNNTLKKVLCFCSPKRVFFRVFDRLGEFTGTQDLHGGIAHRLSDTPTTEELFCLDSGVPDNTPGNEWTPPTGIEWGSNAEWDSTLYEIQRMVCANYVYSPCQDPDADPCAIITY